ncbi:hypothetical protein BJ684DRAFT_2542, partial [Piptocephalis cylindrospora]
TTYQVALTTPLRSWSVRHRYSDFTQLHDTLLQQFPQHPPPLPLPPKHFRIPLFSASALNPASLEARRIGLQSYLRAIAEDEDARWRETNEWKNFLDIPVARSIQGSAEAMSSRAWLEVHRRIQEGLQEVRAGLHRRDAYARRSEVAGARREGLEARSRLRHLGADLQGLESQLRVASEQSTILDGEARRRGDLLEELKGERRLLERLADVAAPLNRTSTPPAEERTGLLGDRSATLPPSSSSPSHSPFIGHTFSTRAFGRSPTAPETQETRGLDNAGIVQLQRGHMQQQDQAVQDLGSVVRRQLEIGKAIHGELELQNDMLDEMTEEVDRLGTKVRAARRQAERIQ